MNSKKLSKVFFAFLISVTIGLLVFVFAQGNLSNYPSPRDYAPNFWFDSEEQYFPCDILDFYYDENFNEVAGEIAKQRYDNLSLEEKLNHFKVFYEIKDEGQEIVYEYYLVYVFNEFRINEHYGDGEKVFVYVDKNTKRINKIIGSAHIGGTLFGKTFIAHNQLNFPKENHINILVEKGSHANCPDTNNNGFIDKSSPFSTYSDTSNRNAYINTWPRAYTDWSEEDKINGVKVNWDSPYYKLVPVKELRKRYTQKYDENRDMITKSPDLGLNLQRIFPGVEEKKYLPLPFGGKPCGSPIWVQKEYHNPEEMRPITAKYLAEKVNSLTRNVLVKFDELNQTLVRYNPLEIFKGQIGGKEFRQSNSNFQSVENKSQYPEKENRPTDRSIGLKDDEGEQQESGKGIASPSQLPTQLPANHSPTNIDDRTDLLSLELQQGAETRPQQEAEVGSQQSPTRLKPDLVELQRQLNEISKRVSILDREVNRLIKDKSKTRSLRKPESRSLTSSQEKRTSSPQKRKENSSSLSSNSSGFIFIPGPSPAELEKRNAQNNSQTTEESENQPPTALFSYSPLKPITNQLVIFDASSSTDPDIDDQIISFQWDFGDKSEITTTSNATTTHSYASLTGASSTDFIVSLTVTDSKGATSSASRTITVFPANVEPVHIVFPKQNQIFSTTTITISGTTTPYYLVSAFSSSTQPLSTTTAASSSDWQITLNLQEEGENTFYFISQDQWQNKSPTTTLTVFLDTTPPVCQFETFPECQTSTQFVIQWSGNDNVSGIEYFELQSRDNSEADWQSFSPATTTATTTEFTGQDEHTYSFRLRAKDKVGNLSNWFYSASTTLSLPKTVVINEIAWMGTGASVYDEWIELYNNTTSTIDLTGWILKAKDGIPSIIISSSTAATTTILPKDFYLLERTDDQTISNIPADLIYTGPLNDAGEKLELYDANNNLIDLVDCSTSTGGWFAGNKDTRTSMERIDPQKSGSEKSNWATNNPNILFTGLNAENQPINGTPKFINSVSEEADDANNSPNRPSNSSPGNGQIVGGDSMVEVDFKASDFSDPDIGNYLLQSYWEIATSSNSSSTLNFSPLFCSATSTTATTSISLPASIDDYYWFRVKYQDNNQLWSDYSEPTWFRVLPPVFSS